MGDALAWAWQLEVAVFPWFVLFELHGRALARLTRHRAAPAARPARHAKGTP